jgi:hypothetical protein
VFGVSDVQDTAETFGLILGAIGGIAILLTWMLLPIAFAVGYELGVIPWKTAVVWILVFVAYGAIEEGSD